MLDDIKKTLWATADKLRANMDAAEYKHLVLGLIFVKYVSDTFAARRVELTRRFGDESDDYFLHDCDEELLAAELEDRDYYKEVNVFWVPESARWEALRAMSDVSTVGIGKTPPRREQHWFSEDAKDVRWVSIRDMGSVGTYAAQTSEFLKREAVERFNVRQVPDNTVLISFKMTIGRVAITDGEMTTNEAIAHFKLSEDTEISSEYIYLHLKQFDYSTLSSTSSITDAVNSKTVREMPILVPAAMVLAVFQDQISSLFDKQKNTEQQAQTLVPLRDTLLPRQISGQLRLPDSVTPVTCTEA